MFEDPLILNMIYILSLNGGLFKLLKDGSTRFSSHCVNTVIETSETEDKKEIQVLWVAPPHSYGCVQFRATVRANQRCLKTQEEETIFCSKLSMVLRCHITVHYPV